MTTLHACTDGRQRQGQNLCWTQPLSAAGSASLSGTTAKLQDVYTAKEFKKKADVTHASQALAAINLRVSCIHYSAPDAARTWAVASARLARCALKPRGLRCPGPCSAGYRRTHQIALPAQGGGNAARAATLRCHAVWASGSPCAAQAEDHHASERPEAPSLPPVPAPGSRPVDRCEPGRDAAGRAVHCPAGGSRPVPGAGWLTEGAAAQRGSSRGYGKGQGGPHPGADRGARHHGAQAQVPDMLTEGLFTEGQRAKKDS